MLIREDGVAKLADLGIATAAESTRITRSGIVLGTAAYMAPEQLEGDEPGPAADIYSLAAVAFEALSGRKARVGATPVEIAHRAATEPPPDLREAWPDAPPGAAAGARSAAWPANPGTGPPPPASSPTALETRPGRGAAARSDVLAPPARRVGAALPRLAAASPRSHGRGGAAAAAWRSPRSAGTTTAASARRRPSGQQQAEKKPEKAEPGRARRRRQREPPAAGARQPAPRRGGSAGDPAALNDQRVRADEPGPIRRGDPACFSGRWTATTRVART